MKKYSGGIYGGSVAARLVYFQKMGVDQAICNMIKDKARKIADLSCWEKKYEFPKGVLTQLEITAIVPHPSDVHELFDKDFPHFCYGGAWGIIDRIHVDKCSTQFRFIPVVDREFGDASWHTVREGLDLQDTCLLYEFIDDVIDDIVVLEPDVE